MAKYETDIIQYLYETYNEQGFEYIDTTALDIIIQEYLETPDNGYFSEEFTYWDEDSTAYLTTVIDSTSPSISVLEWKEDNLENSFNQSFLQNGQISIRDHNSPNYELIDFRSVLFDFDTSTSINYLITPDATADLFIEYEYSKAEKVDGMYLQEGLDGVQTYPSIGKYSLHGYYIAFSNDGHSWKYISNSAPVGPSQGIDPVIYNNKQDAIDNHFFRAIAESALLPLTIEEIIFTETAIEAKYWRVHFVDILDNLTLYGIHAGYTGYTVSISHLRFQQFREHGTAVFDKTVERVKTKGTFSTGDIAADLTASGSSWFTSAEFSIQSQGIKELSTHISGRIYADSTAEFRLQLQVHGSASWETIDSWEFLSEGNSSLHDAREIENPNTDLAPWTFKYRLQDRAPIGSPTIEFRFALMTSFRSSETT